MDRRAFLTNLVYSTAGIAVASSIFSSRETVLAQTSDIAKLRVAGYGDLLPTAAKNTGEMILKLPRGFEYNVIGRTGKQMSDGRVTPRAHDGMATFKVKDELRVIRNHEVNNLTRMPIEGIGIGATNHYDETCGGGTTTLVIDPKTRAIVRDFVSLSGTLINCAGGPTPWGSWISCEETTLGKTVRTSSTGTKRGGFPKPHGYCFEVFASSDVNQPPMPLKAMGRFEHEAIAVDPKTGIVYLTEDYNPCGFYRFIPRRNKRLPEGGTLQMLAIEGREKYDTRSGQTTRSTLATKWVTIEQPDPESADIDPSAVYKQGLAKGGASFARLEGCCSDKYGRIYFTATSGGDSKGGQIWMYESNGRDRGLLTLLFESTSRRLLDMPDNVCLMPKSQLLFVCEDSDYVGEGGTPENLIRILTPDGRISDFAENINKEDLKSEFCGTTFSKDGKTLFFNLQRPGLTCAVWGDWSKFRT